MRARALGFLGLSATTGLCAAGVWLTASGSPERAIAAFLLLLLLPGLAVTRLLPQAQDEPGGARLLLTLAISLAVVIIDSAVLYVAGIRLDVHSWTLSVGGITFVALVAGLLARAPASRGLAPRPQLSQVAAISAGVLVAGALIVGAVLTTQAGVRAQAQADRFTALWALPMGQGPPGVRIGVFNHQGAAESYVLSVSVNGSPYASLNPTVQPGGRWETSLPVSPRGHQLIVRLSSVSRSPSIQRTVQLRLTPTPSSSNNLS
ncbi:MAG TPA: hypothetical protein VE983_00075 [Solirubrobacteraceae bacterium]|nr:hypothetical protein [Solirubrobacteraceae bacterium]